MKKTILEMLSPEYEHAESLIRAGKVLVNEEVVFIPSTKINPGSKIRIKENKKWVSRGAYKLLEAIDKFELDFTNKVVLDIGSSTGGFTQVAIKFGAQKIYSLDSGSNQLDYTLRINEKVHVMEKTNLKDIELAMFKEPIDIVVADVSFISLKEVIKVLSFFKKISLITLIKPQFEASRDKILKGGIVDVGHHNDIINNIIDYAQDAGFMFIDKVKSPIKGYKSKNIEYLAYFKKDQ